MKSTNQVYPSTPADCSNVFVAKSLKIVLQFAVIIVVGAHSAAYAKDDVQRCFEGCRALYRELAESCDDEEANCIACGGVWRKGELSYEPSGWFCAAFGGGIWPPPRVSREELDACLAGASVSCNANAQAEYRACAQACRRLRAGAITADH